MELHEIEPGPIQIFPGLNITGRVPIIRIHCQKNIFYVFFMHSASLTFGPQRGKTMFLALTHGDKLKPYN